tara:strand:+ start:196 stop:366 length:171 start_codon:yes stop_codon:yes gene_type:complete
VDLVQAVVVAEPVVSVVQQPQVMQDQEEWVQVHLLYHLYLFLEAVVGAEVMEPLVD